MAKKTKPSVFIFYVLLTMFACVVSREIGNFEGFMEAQRLNHEYRDAEVRAFVNSMKDRRKGDFNDRPTTNPDDRDGSL